VALLYVSWLAGMLSVLAPCVISLLPALVARNATTGKRARSPVYVVLGLGLSVFVFSILLKSTTALLGIPQATWQFISGSIVMIFGIVTLFPGLWERTSQAMRLQQASQKTTSAALQQSGAWGDALLGASLGPVFSACSPAYAVIVAVILPTDPARGLLYLGAFVAGLMATLYVVLVGGTALVQKLGWSVNPHGWFKRIMGIFFIIVGVSIILGFDKDFLGYLVQNGWFDWQMNLEHRLGL